MRAQIHFLNLMFPPMSNQEADWFWDVPEVRAQLAGSHLYMIGQRREVLFDNYCADPDTCIVHLDLVCGATRLKDIQIPLLENGVNGNIELELGPKLIRIWKSGAERTEQSVVRWWTADKLLFDYWRGNIQAIGLDSFRCFTEFHLYYVGLSREGDSFARLFANGHKNRAKILSSETQISPTARLTDELYIFILDIEELIITVMEGDDEASIENALYPKPFKKVQMAADAEKAFIKIMQTKYNKMKYEQYPVSSDGLHGVGLTRWAFMVNEPLQFRTEDVSMRFGRFMEDPLDPNNSDFIFVDGEEVCLVQSDGENLKRGSKRQAKP